METIRPSDPMNENGGCVDLNETLEKVRNGLLVDPDFSLVQDEGIRARISTTAIDKVEVENQSFDTEKRIAGKDENGECCFEIGGIRNDSLVDESLGSIPKVDDEFIHENVLPLNGSNPIDSGNTQEVSRRNVISLFADVFGSSGEFDQCNDSTGDLNLEVNFQPFHNSAENSTAIVPYIEETKQADTISNQEYKFSVGDFVWAKIKTQLWWPGQICDPSTASIDASKSLKNCLVVRYFGNGSFVRCALHQLKPFYEYFVQMSKQSISRSFRSAVDKAVCEIGMRVKLEMTCSCFQMENTNACAAKEKNGEFSEFSIKWFDPVNFLAYVRDLAKGVLVPGVIDATIAHNRLSVFNRSMGHCQLSMDRLLPSSDRANGKNQSDSKAIQSIVSADLGEKNQKSENGYELRDRQKNKSFTSSNQIELEMKSQIRSSEPTVKSGTKKSTKKPLKKPITEESSAEMLLELCFTALDCLYPRKSACFNVAFRYFSHFRKINFSSNVQGTNEKVATNSEHCSVNIASGVSDKNQMAEICATQEYPLEKGVYVADVKQKKRRQEKKEPRISVGLKNTCTAERMNVEGAVAASSSMIIKCQNAGPTDSEARPAPKKRKKAEPAPSNIGDVTTSGSVVIDFEKLGPTPAGQSMPKKRRKKTAETPASCPPASLQATKAGTGLLDFKTNVSAHSPMIIDFQKSVAFSAERHFVWENAMKNAEATPVLPRIKQITEGSGFSGNNTGLQVEDLQFKGSAPPQGKLEFKRRKKKEGSKMKDFDGKSNVVLPNVKGSSAKFVPVLKDLQVKTIPEAGLKETSSFDTNLELTANNVEPEPEPGLLESKKRKIHEENSECGIKIASLLPDLNETAPEPNSINSVTPKSQHRKRSKASKVFDVNSGEELGAALLLKFTDDLPMPSKETLISTFCMFGQLKESETLVLSESKSAQVVFTKNSDARDAFLSLKMCSPFGPALVNYRLHHLSSVGGYNIVPILPTDGLNNPVKAKEPRKPRAPPNAKSEAPLVHNLPARAAFGLNSPQNAGPNISVIRQNLEMMTSMMEKAGDNLAPQVRAKLESEINGLLSKVRAMSSPSSSSHSVFRS